MQLRNAKRPFAPGALEPLHTVLRALCCLPTTTARFGGLPRGRLASHARAKHCALLRAVD
jgi:hypothetical protein